MPTPEQWDEIQAILENDCVIAERYINETGDTCAIGALALAAGVERSVLWNANMAPIDSYYNDSMASIRSALYSRFDLSADVCRSIQRSNDKYKRPATRRKHVLAKVAELRAQS